MNQALYTPENGLAASCVCICFLQRQFTHCLLQALKIYVTAHAQSVPVNTRTQSCRLNRKKANYISWIKIHCLKISILLYMSVFLQIGHEEPRFLGYCSHPANGIHAEKSDLVTVGCRSLHCRVFLTWSHSTHTCGVFYLIALVEVSVRKFVLQKHLTLSHQTQTKGSSQSGDFSQLYNLC